MITKNRPGPGPADGTQDIDADRVAERAATADGSPQDQRRLEREVDAERAATAAGVGLALSASSRTVGCRHRGPSECTGDSTPTPGKGWDGRCGDAKGNR